MSREALFPVDITGIEACLICGAETGEPTVTPCACGPVHPNCAASAADLYCALCNKKYAFETHKMSVIKLIFITIRNMLLFLIIMALIIATTTLLIVLPSIIFHAPIQFMSVLPTLYKIFVFVFTTIPPVGIIILAIILYESRGRSVSLRLSIILSAICIDIIFLMFFATVINFDNCKEKQEQWCADLDPWNFFVIKTVLKNVENISFFFNLFGTLAWTASMFYRSARKDSIKYVVCNKIDPAPVSV